MRSSRFVSFVVALLLASATARGETAKEAYNRGLSLYAAGNFKEAADAFLAAYKLKRKALILFNIGQAYRKHGDLDEARVYYRRFLDEAPAEEKAPLEQETRGYLDELDRLEAAKVAPAPPPPTPPPAPPKVETPPPPAKVETPPPPAKVETPPPPAKVETPPAPTPTPTKTPTTVATATAPVEKSSLAKKWWVWTIVGVVVVGAAVGVGVGVGTRSTDPSTALGARTPSF